MPNLEQRRRTVGEAETNPFLAKFPQQDLISLLERGVLIEDGAFGARRTEKEAEEGRQKEDHISSGSERNCLPERNIRCSEDR